MFKSLNIFSTFKKNKSLIKLALPIFLELLLGIVIGFVDQFQLSYDQKGVNAIGQVNTIVMLVNITFQVLTVASLILITQLNARKNTIEARKVYQVAFYFNLIVSVTCSLILFFFAREILSLLKPDPSVMDKAVLYMQFTGAWIVIQAMISTFGSFLRANKKMIQTTIVSFIMNILNIGGNAIAIYFVNHQNAATNSGVIGVAVSSTVSRIVALAIVIIMYIKYVGVNLSFIKMVKSHPNKTLVQLLKIGIPSAGETFSYNFAQMVILLVINSTFVSFTNITIQANIKSYISNITSIIYIFASGFSQAMQVQEGELISTDRKEEAKTLILETRRMSCFFSLVFSILVLAISYPLFSFLLRTSIEESPTLGVGLNQTQISIPIICVIILSFNIILEQGRASNIVLVKGLQSAGDIMFPVISAIVSCWSVAVFGTYIFGSVLKLGVIGVFIANLLDECLRATVFYFRLRSNVWMKKNIIKDLDSNSPTFTNVKLETVLPLTMNEVNNNTSLDELSKINTVYANRKNTFDDIDSSYLNTKK